MEFRDALIGVISTLLALMIWELFLRDVCSRIRHNRWLNYKFSHFYGKIGREFFHKIFRINNLNNRGRSPSRSEFIDNYSQSSFGSKPLHKININVQDQERVFEGVYRIEVEPKGYESSKYTLTITILDSNGEDKITKSLEISRDDKRRLAKKMYGIFVLYHKKWNN